PMETPAIQNGDVIYYNVSIDGGATDETPNDNFFVFQQIVNGSFDPNDITCLEGSVVSPEMIGEYLHYTINFENTGDAAATFIVVKDVIDEAKFDVSSLQVLNASHNVEVRVTGNKVEFIFDDINLGATQKGNVIFKIKSLNSLQVNDEVMNKADIFFDYNFPITTNEATTAFQVLGVKDLAKDASVSIYPNPSNSIVNIKADGSIKSYELYDLQGRVLQTSIVNSTAAILDISARAKGIYFVKVVTEKGVSVQKIAKN
ncbi:T9SS type A sorting domain-containing protein, partial [Flavobacterium zepuense]